MEGGDKRQTRGKSQNKPKKDDTTPTESVDTLAEHEAMEAIQANIIAEIQAVRLDLKKELVDFRGEINQKLNDITSELKEITERVEETEQRVADMEEWSADAKEVLSHTLELHQSIQAQLTDLEARSRRNNIRIHGIPEGVEGDNMKTFLEEFIKTELSLPDISLNIQRCHRSLGSRPPQGSNPRSVIVYFLEYTTKERVLRSAWGKKEIHYNGKRVFFEQDYPAEIVMKRKAYTSIRRVLKEKEIRFQTLHPAKLRVFFNTGSTVYNDARDATDDLKKRGLIPDSWEAETSAQNTPSLGPKQPTWETVGAKRRRHQGDRLKHIQDKLKGFRRNEETS